LSATNTLSERLSPVVGVFTNNPWYFFQLVGETPNGKAHTQTIPHHDVVTNHLLHGFEVETLRLGCILELQPLNFEL
jgi:hypothetical protein